MQEVVSLLSQISKRWKFPDFYYDLKQSFVDDSGVKRVVELVFIDTVLLAGNNDDNADRFMPPPGPRDVNASEDQWQVRATS